jgi:hypothetical protein
MIVGAPGRDHVDALIRQLRRISKDVGIPTFLLRECPMCGEQWSILTRFALYCPPSGALAVGHLLCDEHSDPKHARSGAMEDALIERTRHAAVEHIAGTADGVVGVSRREETT